MGIERFFRSIEENKITNLISTFTQTLEKRLVTKNLYIDFNSIIYISSFRVVGDLNRVLYGIISGKRDDRWKKLVEDYKLDVNEKTKPEEFTKSVTEDLDGTILDKIIEYVANILMNYIDPDQLEYLYIAVDGVPTKSKIVEQKKRRWMGGLISEIDKAIFKKYESDVKKNKTRYLYEKQKISWNRARITPGTEFMDMLNDTLHSQEFEINIKQICPKLKKCTISGPYDPGEGEKKIVDDLRSREQEVSTYVIYSPDSDVSLLGLLLNTEFTLEDPRRVTTLKIMRHNQQKGNYDIVDIDKLAANLHRYVKDGVSKEKIKKAPDQDRVVRDIVLLLTIFGNDFLPKIEAFNVRYDFDRIIDKYVQALVDNYDQYHRYLVDYDRAKEKWIIDFVFLVDILKYLKKDEGGNLQKVYVTNNYHNYNRLKRLVDADETNFTTRMTEFLDELQRFNYAISQGSTFEELITKYTKGERNQWLQQLKKMTRLDSQKIEDDERFIKAYVKQYRRNNEPPKVNVIFRRYRRNLQDQFHRDKLEHSVKKLDSSWPITKYDRESYLFQNMLEEYRDKLNAQSLDLGYVWVDPKTYTWKTEKIEKGVKRYYDEFFNIKDIEVDNPKMEKLLAAYIEGLVWVFEFYYNRMDREESRKFADTWFYPHSKAPLLTQLHRYMETKAQRDQDYLEKVSEKLDQHRVDRELYFNPLEHFMYVTPVNLNKSLVPEEYHGFIKNKEYYPDILKMAQEVLKGESGLINCRGSIFLNKCDLELGNWSWTKDRKFLKDLRKIRISGETRIRTGVHKKIVEVKEIDYPPFIGVDKLVKRYKPFD